MAGIYLHIPFCKQACHYCDFHFSTSHKMKDDFVHALIEEIKIQRDYLNGEPLHTIYFGGGTPSLLSKENLVTIFETIHAVFKVSSNAEITLEANPDDINAIKLNDFKALGINRLSIGVQSFFDEDLKFMNRVHDANMAIDCIKKAQDFGFENLTIDLIYGTPTLSNLHWSRNLEMAFNMDIPHLSCYCLTVEQKTALANFIRKGKVANVDEQRSSEHFEMMLHAMNDKGYEQYEISNFCKQNRYSRHNTAYWMKEKYLGVGPSAHSYNGISRQWNVSNNAKYIQSLATGTIPFELETLSANQQFNEYIMTALRTKWGVDLAKIQDEFGLACSNYLLNQITEFIGRGLMFLADDHLYLTNQGKLLADDITSELFII